MRPLGRAPKWDEAKACWIVKINITGRNGKPSTKPIPLPGIAKEDVDGAKARAASVTAVASNRGAVLDEAERTCDEQFALFCKVRRTEGLKSVDNDEGKWKRVSPIIGTKSVRTITPQELALLVQHLNAEVRARKIFWSYGQAIWRLVVRFFTLACSDDYPQLKVREDNPTAKLSGPKAGQKREGPFLWPNEFLALMNCTKIPLHWKQTFALSTYLGTRGGELDALDFETGVNLEHGYVSIYQARDRKTGKIGPTKTKNRRKFRFEPALRPLLEALHRQKGGAGLVVDMCSSRNWARDFRKYLERALTEADIEIRPELLANGEGTRRISFHDQRHTYMSWRAIRVGEDPLKIQRAAGHASMSQTNDYINAVEVFDVAAFGEVFPPLPACVLGIGNSSGNESAPDSEEAEKEAGSDAGDHLRRMAAPTEKQDPSEGDVPIGRADVAMQPAAVSIADPVEAALAVAITKASAAGEWGVVATLATELSARRLARANVVDIASRRVK